MNILLSFSKAPGLAIVSITMGINHAHAPIIPPSNVKSVCRSSRILRKEISTPHRKIIKKRILIRFEYKLSPPCKTARKPPSMKLIPANRKIPPAMSFSVDMPVGLPRTHISKKYRYMKLRPHMVNFIGSIRSSIAWIWLTDDCMVKILTCQVFYTVIFFYLLMRFK